MRVAIIGLPGSGKTTVFRALTGRRPDPGQEPTPAAVAVPDPRLDRLSAIYQPRKTTPAAVEFVDLPAGGGLRAAAGELGPGFLHAVRPASALLHVIDAFSSPDEAAAGAAEAVETVDAELALADLDQCERRIARLQKEGARHGAAQRELELLQRAGERLGRGEPLRSDGELAAAEELRSFALLTAKPVITVLNVAEHGSGFDPGQLPEAVAASRTGPRGRIETLAAEIEAEIAELEPVEARAFLADYGIAEPARERIIRACYGLLGLMCFFTVGPDEVRAWTVARNATARQGAAAIHSDIARGFIRAEVVDYDTVIAVGSFEAAKKKGRLRLEGRDYRLQDGDVVSYRFNV